MPSVAEDLRGTTHRLALQLDWIAARDEKQAPFVTPERMSSLLSELLSAGAGLKSEKLPAPGSDREFDCELSEYRRQVERLRDFMPSIHKQLLAERARIEGRRSRLVSVREWVRASQQTL